MLCNPLRQFFIEFHLYIFFLKMLKNVGRGLMGRYVIDLLDIYYIEE